MSKLFVIPFLVLILFGCLNTAPISSIVVADTSPTYYRITNSNTILYRTPLDDSSPTNVYFTLPQSYFVKFNSVYDEQFLNVTYLDFVGYVLSSQVTPVYSTPQTPFLQNITFDAQGIANLVIRNTPSTQGDFVGTIPFNATNISYIANTIGEQSTINQSNIWYFCKYTSFEQGILLGYVYAPLTYNLTDIVLNNEDVALEPYTSASTNTILAPELQDSTNLLLILGLTIPTLLLLLVIFKPQKHKRQKELRRQINNLNLLNPKDDD